MKRPAILINLVVALLWITAGITPMATGRSLKLFGVIPLNSYVALGIGFLWLVALIAMLIRQSQRPLS